MNMQQIEEYINALKVGKIMRKLPSAERRKAFEQLLLTSPDFSAKQFHCSGLKGAFGLDDQHRQKISAGIRASLAKKKATYLLNEENKT